MQTPPPPGAVAGAVARNAALRCASVCKNESLKAHTGGPVWRNSRTRNASERSRSRLSR